MHVSKNKISELFLQFIVLYDQYDDVRVRRRWSMTIIS